MKGTFKETVKRKQRPFWQILVMILAAVIVVNMLITSSNLLGPKYAGVASVFILLAATILCGLIVLKFLAYYSYRIIEDKLVFEEIVGKRSKIILAVDINQIESIKPYRDSKEDKSVINVYKFVCDREYDDFYVGEFNKEGKKYRFVFKPSSRFLNILNRDLQLNK